MSVPPTPGRVAMTEVPARNWICVTVTPAPEPGATVVVRVAEVPTVMTAPGRGEVTTAVGAEFTAFTAIEEDVADAPAESKATADSV